MEVIAIFDVLRRHQPGNLPFMKYAVYLARRAGLEAGDILNTRPFAEFRKGLKRAKP